MKKNFLKKKIVKVLASAEFYDLDTQQWEMVGSMQGIRMMNKKVKKTETKNKEKEQRDGVDYDNKDNFHRWPEQSM